MNANLVAEIIALIQAAGSIGLELYLKLDQIRQLGPDEQENIRAQVEAAIQIDEDTKQRIDDWKKAHGFA
jgi:hypothetical protein